MLQIFFQQAGRGPGKVVNNFLEGLEQTKEPHVCNPIEIETSEPSICLNGHPILYTDLIKYIHIGPNIATLPTDPVHFDWNSSLHGPRPPDGRRIILEGKYKKIIVPSEWVYNKYKKYIPENLLEIWPVGINTEEFPEVISNSGALTPLFDCLIYFKRRTEEELDHVKSLLDSLNQKWTVVEYGDYSEEDFKKIMKNSRYCFSLNNTESQGIAIQEIMSSNLPIFAWDVDTWTDRGKEHECEATSVPYWNELCGEKVYSLSGEEDKFKTFINNLESYSPRKFVLDNLNLKKQSKELVDLVSK